MKAWLIIINDFAHDLFSGLWISTLLVIYLLKQKAGYLPGSPLEAFLLEIITFFFWLGILSILTIIITGIIRLRHYRKREVGEPEPVKSRALIVKHLILGPLFLIGTYFAYNIAYR